MLIFGILKCFLIPGVFLVIVLILSILSVTWFSLRRNLVCDFPSLADQRSRIYMRNEEYSWLAV